MEVSLEIAFKVACQELGEAIVREKCLETELTRRMQEEVGQEEAKKEAVADDKSNGQGQPQGNGKLPDPVAK